MIFFSGVWRKKEKGKQKKSGNMGFKEFPKLLFYKNGGKASDLKLTSEIGYVSLGQSIFSHTRGFKFLERYCTTLSFSKQEFSRAVSILRQEYEEEEQRILKDKIGLAKAY